MLGLNIYYSTFLLLCSFLLLTFSAFSQSFSIEIDKLEAQGELGFDVVTDAESIYVVSNAVCEDSIRWCTPVHSLSQAGEEQWSIILEDFLLSNRDNLSLTDGNLYVTSHSPNYGIEDPVVQLAIINQLTGDVVDQVESPLPSDLFAMISNGHFVHNDLIYVYGSSRSAIDNNDVFGYIHIMDVAGTIIDSVYIDLEDVNIIYDVAISEDGKIYLILDTREYDPWRGYVYIVQFDPSTLEVTTIWKESLSTSTPRFTISSYGFIVAGDPSSSEGLYQLLGISFEGSELWKESYYDEENIFNNFITDMHTTLNGDILITSKYSEPPTNQDDVNEKAMIVRLTEWGEELWLKTYPTYMPDNSGQTFSTFWKVDETLDSSIVAAGYVSNTSDFFDPLFENNTKVVKVRPSGCFFEDDCDPTVQNEYITSTEDIRDGDDIKVQVIVSPIPASSHLTISSDVKFNGVIVRDAAGIIVLRRTVNTDVIDLDIATLSSGVYFLTLESASEQFYMSKFIVE